ncbi:uncharacterized protein L201_007825 [Kwoniella dendrophila CBS 6074]|uniref:Uncharacterized protein n=1 Tax=Kwoniella dendrophila CBS 6074 TaxID=1295534 RepID=A0AAX4K642_9TREE
MSSSLSERYPPVEAGVIEDEDDFQAPLQHAGYLKDGWSSFLLKPTEKASTSNLSHAISLIRPGTENFDPDFRETTSFNDHQDSIRQSSDGTDFSFLPRRMHKIANQSRKHKEGDDKITEDTLDSVFVVQQSLSTYPGLCESLCPAQNPSVIGGAKSRRENVNVEMYYLHTFPLNEMLDEKKRNVLISLNTFSHLDEMSCNVKLTDPQSIFTLLDQKFSSDPQENDWYYSEDSKLHGIPTEFIDEPENPAYKYISQKFPSELDFKFNIDKSLSSITNTNDATQVLSELEEVLGRETLSLKGASKFCIIAKE